MGSGGGAGVLKSLFLPLRKDEPGRGGGRKARLEDVGTSLGEAGYVSLEAGEGEGGRLPSNSPSELLSGPEGSMFAYVGSSSRCGG